MFGDARKNPNKYDTVSFIDIVEYMGDIGSNGANKVVVDHLDMKDKEDLIYDEDDSVAFIQNYLPQELKGKFSNDDINYIVDLIYEFYESKGFLDENSDDNAEIDIDEDELIGFVVKNAQKDGVGKFSPEDITFIVQGELEYCDSINMFD